MPKRYNRVRLVLYDKERSQSWLAKKIGISDNSMSSICRNRSQPKLQTLYKIAAALKVDVCELLVKENPELKSNEE